MNTNQKSKNLTGLLLGALGVSDPVCRYDISRELRLLHPDAGILETEDWEFDFLEFAARGGADVRICPATHPMIESGWQGVEKGIVPEDQIALYEVSWGGHELLVLSAEYDSCGTKRRWVIGEDEGVVNRFFGEVCRTLSEVTDEILVWNYGSCHRDPDLYRDIQTASMEALILPSGVKEELIEDFEKFFASEALYQRYGLAWRRGLILVGPPGNGKTHAIKALVQHVRKPCLYVRNFKAHHGPQWGVSRAFAQARKMAPCVMVLEDIDSLVEPQVRSFFLNEMDGFGSNRGVLVVGTSNYPEKLDPAIADRPSRFDRKITFGLPAMTERFRFLERIVASWEPELKPDLPELEGVAEATDGFSFAYLKELARSSLFAWLREQKPGAMATVMNGLVESLRQQMASEPSPVPADENEDGDDD